MYSAVASAIIAAVGGLSLAVWTYWLTKKKEREAEWRKEKLIHYKEFVESLSGIIGDDVSPEGQIAFAQASNNLLLFSPQLGIEALDDFRCETRVSNSNRSIERHDELLANLLLAIRRDIGVLPADDPTTFHPELWTSGVKRASES